MAETPQSDPLESAFEAPAKLVDAGMRSVERAERHVISKVPLKFAEEYWATLGPGLTTGAADDDPSGIATYSQAGAQYGTQLVWLALFTFPFMATVQEMCARIGLVSGRGLAANIRRHYAPGVLYVVTVLLFAANAFNIAADLGAMAAATRLLAPQFPRGLLIILFAAFMLALQIYTTYARYAKYLKYLTFALLSYVAVALVVPLDWNLVARSTLVPHFSWTRSEIVLLCAILGTTISPYLFFWQTSQEIEEGILRGETTSAERRAAANPRTIRSMRTDVWSGMFFSNLITFFIFAACAGTLHLQGVTTIKTAADAAQALKPFGVFAEILFTFGIVGTGLLAVPVLAGSSAYAFAESFGWTFGLYRKLSQAYAFYGVIIVSMIVGVVANFMHLDPIQGLIYAAVGNGVIAPVVLYFVLRISGNTRIMGEYANSKLAAVIGWITFAAMALAGIAALATL